MRLIPSAIAALLSLGYVNSCVAASHGAVPVEYVQCEPGMSLDDAVAIFSEPGNAIHLFPVIEPDAVALLVETLRGSPAFVAEVRERVLFMAVGSSQTMPPGIVSIGWFDADRCVLGSANGVPVTVLIPFAEAFGPPEQLGPSI